MNTEQPDVVVIDNREFVIERLDLFGETYYACGSLPLYPDRDLLIRDLTTDLRRYG